MGHAPPAASALLAAATAVLASAALFAPPAAHAEPLSVSTGRGVYSYGDFLSFTVTVDDAVMDVASFRIVDSNGTSSSTVAMRINGTDTTVTAPVPLSPDRFGIGTYTIIVEYDGGVASTEFDLVDSGRVVIPFWIRDVAGLWLRGEVDDAGFLKTLVKEGVIADDQTVGGETRIEIPGWYAVNARLFVGGDISGNEFVAGLQYLADRHGGAG